MRTFSLVVVGLACVSAVYGATFEKEAAAGPQFEFKPHDPKEPHEHEVVPLPKEPKSEDTIGISLVHIGKTNQRAAASVGPLKTTEKGAQDLIVQEHNRLRAITPSEDTFKMSWDDDARKIAQAWADNCDFRHPTNSDAEKKQYMKTTLYSCGQNIAMGTGAMAWNTSIKMWYDEIKDFKWGVDTGKVVGHYTAMTWAKTHKLGCAHASCKAGTPQAFNFFVCNYCPAGNIYPNHMKPFTPGTKCKQCGNDCDSNLCTNPCAKTNSLSNCEKQSGSYKPLFPAGCPAGENKLKDQCAATCECFGKKLY